MDRIFGGPQLYSDSDSQERRDDFGAGRKEARVHASKDTPVGEKGTSKNIFACSVPERFFIQ